MTNKRLEFREKNTQLNLAIDKQRELRRNLNEHSEEYKEIIAFEMGLEKEKSKLLRDNIKFG
jgi:hypothetical protein